MVNFQDEKSFIIKIVKKASEITEWFRMEGYRSYTKQDHTPVTLADYASQMYVVSQLNEVFPDDMIVAEENIRNLKGSEALAAIRTCYKELNIQKEIDLNPISNKGLKQSRRVWTIDPIDGTIGFQKNLWYAIGIGLIEEETSQLGVISIPNHDEKGNAIFIAENQKGAKVSHGNTDFKSIHVSKTSILKDSIMCQSLHYNEEWVKNLGKNAGISKVIEMDSMAKFCKIAEGTADFYIKPLHPDFSSSWDFVPGDLLVREAGGKVTNLNNEKLIFKESRLINSPGGLIASNALLHEKILSLINNK